MLDKISKEARQKWTYIGKHGCNPPAELVPSDWLSKLVAVSDENNADKMTKHYRPDFILASVLSANAVKVSIADVNIVWEDIEAGVQRKLRAYEPLRMMISEHLGVKANVEIVPIVFTDRGVPRSGLVDCLKLLGVCKNVTNLLKKIQENLFKDNQMIFDFWKEHHNYCT